ncbi:hypothetical protein VNO77_36887 [Canavalia gladiata]|uniref:Uncharacterized protein n=1 Tax=Canavalia gladiata TaxID=3824 RepID=A0AAN9PWU4_CANGL
MSYLIRISMSTTVAAADGHTQKSLHHSRRRLFSAGDSSELRPSVIGKSDVEGQADDSLRKVMYFNCWGQG